MYTDSIKNLDFIRAYAVTLVAGAHLFLFLGNPVYFGVFEPGILGPLGVAIFFVHTALVLMFSLERNSLSTGKATAVNFYIRRIFRIYPLSILVASAYFFFNLPRAITYEFPISAKQYIANLFLVENVLKNSETVSVLWSLPYEIQMYITLPFFFFAFKKNNIGKHFILILFLVLLVLGLRIHPWILKWNGQQDVFQIPLVFKWFLCFLPGLWAYKAYTEKARERFHFLWLPLMLVLITIYYSFSYNDFKNPLLAAIVGLMIPYFKQCPYSGLNKITNLIAKYSYSIYLTHLFCFWFALNKITGSLFIQLSVACLLLVLLCYVFYNFLEKPCIEAGKRIASKVH